MFLVFWICWFLLSMPAVVHPHLLPTFTYSSYHKIHNFKDSKLLQNEFVLK